MMGPVSLDASLTLRVPGALKQRKAEEAKALGISLSQHVLYHLEEDDMQRKLSVIFERRQQRGEYARILRILGESRIAGNLNQIAYNLNTGDFIATPEVIAQINEAYEAVLYIRTLLIESMGVKVH